MLLSVDAFPAGWVRNDGINENFDAVFTNEDESIVVLTTVDVFESVGAAEDQYETTRSGFAETKEYEVGDEGFWTTRNEEVAYTIFRHSNALGQVAALRESGTEVVPDQGRSQQYARAMYEHWQRL